MAVFAPIPAASVVTATAVKPGLLRSRRKPTRRLRSSPVTVSIHFIRAAIPPLSSRKPNRKSCNQPRNMLFFLSRISVPPWDRPWPRGGPRYRTQPPQAHNQNLRRIHPCGSLLPQRLHRIESRGTAGGYVAAGQNHRDHHPGDEGECCPVPRADSVEQARHHSG